MGYQPCASCQSPVSYRPTAQGLPNSPPHTYNAHSFFQRNTGLRFGNSDLKEALDTQYTGKDLPRYDEFHELMGDLHTIDYALGKAGSTPHTIDGMVKDIAHYVGNPEIKPESREREFRRFKGERQYINDVVGSFKLGSTVDDLPAAPGPVKDFFSYRDTVRSYVGSSEKNQWLNALAESQPQVLPLATLATQADLNDQIHRTESPLPKLYASIDTILSYNLPRKEAIQEARKSYLTLVAEEALFNEEKMNTIMFGEDHPSTSMARRFERWGLDFHEMKEKFQSQQDNQDMEYQPVQENIELSPPMELFSSEQAQVKETSDAEEEPELEYPEAA